MTSQILKVERVELLRRILVRQQRRDISYDEAADIAEALISFFEALAETA